MDADVVHGAIVKTAIAAVGGLFLLGVVAGSKMIERTVPAPPVLPPCQDTLRRVWLSPVETPVSPYDATPLCGPGQRARLLDASQAPQPGVWVECTCR